MWGGVDPGLDGACAIIGAPSVTRVEDCPVLKSGSGSRREYDLIDLERWAHAFTECAFVVIEDPPPIPRFGVVTARSLGEAIGIWKAILSEKRVRHMFVAPSKWKADMGLRGKGKEASLKLARQLFPEAIPDLMRKKDDGRAEALLLAEWARKHA
tara:strand:+ start:428 stop:892 length:465 start_codon:yes stop_codon:yes gene_type:complete